MRRARLSWISLRATVILLSICSPSNQERISTWTRLRGEVCGPVSCIGDSTLINRPGQILVLIPRSFCGAIHIRGRKNGHHILPALSITSRLIKSTCCNRDNLFHVGEPSQSGEGTDFLELRSCQGKIIVGYSGEDSYEPNDTDCWQKGCGLSKA